jgi:hypothetical protein
MVSRAGQVFDASGAIVDPKIEESLRRFVQGFVASVERQAKQHGG